MKLFTSLPSLCQHGVPEFALGEGMACPLKAPQLEFFDEKKPLKIKGLNSLAEGVRFELTKGLRPRQFSRLVHSTALPTFLCKRRIIHQLFVF